MSSEGLSEENTTRCLDVRDKILPAGQQVTRETKSEEELNTGTPNGPEDAQTFSPSTEGSVECYTERTVQELDSRQQGVSFLPPLSTTWEGGAGGPEVPKSSESEPSPKVPDVPKLERDVAQELDHQEDVICEASFFRARVNYFQTDTSEIEFDNAGAAPTDNQPIFIPPRYGELTSSEQ